MISSKLELFCGTGGVGKTTLATAKAISLTKKNKKVLLITIDPAKRLKQILGISDEDSGKISSIKLQSLGDTENQSFDALLMDSLSTLKRVSDEDFDNNIIKILTRPYGGMNEIMSIIEVNYQLNNSNYDVIVLDTPPGKHFLDFLNSMKKINRFFDSSFVEVFKILKSPLEGKSAGFFGKIVKTGIDKLLSHLESVTGKSFIQDFIDAVYIIYSNKDIFLDALEFEKDIEKENFCNWYLVTNTEHHKIREVLELKEDAQKVLKHGNCLIINKSLPKELYNWDAPQTGDYQKLKDSMLHKENEIDYLSQKSFNKTLHFEEISASSPEQHVIELAKIWARL